MVKFYIAKRNIAYGYKRSMSMYFPFYNLPDGYTDLGIKRLIADCDLHINNLVKLTLNQKRVTKLLQ